MSIKKILKRFFTDQKGSVLFIIATGMVALLGITALVTDIGLIASNRQKLVNIMDAAALAGGQYLPEEPATAMDVAMEYALLNNYVSSGIDDPAISFSTDYTSITVSGSKVVNLAFAKLLGFYSTTVSAAATAQKQYVTSMNGVLPFAVDNSTVLPGAVNPGDTKTFTYDNNALGPGTYGSLALGGITGDSILYNNIVNTYTGLPIVIPSPELSEPGANVGKLRSAIHDRIYGHELCTYDNHEPNCPKIITVLTYDRSLSTFNGRSGYFWIVGFTSFFLDNSCLDNGKFEITGKYIKTLSDGGKANVEQTDYGVASVRLIK